MKKIVVSSILPGLLLSIADIVTIVLMYAICSMVGGFLQPAIFFGVGVPLIALNAVILGLPQLTKRFGKKTARAKTTATVIYYLATLGFTLATSLWIDVRWYVTVVLLVIVLYLCACGGVMLYFRSRNQETRAQQDEEAAKVRLLLLPIADEIRESRKWLEPALYYRLSRQFGAVEHRLSRPTSFDRVESDAIGQLEEQIYTKLTAARAAVQYLSRTEDTAGSAKTVLSLLEEIEYLAKSKEMILVETGMM